MKRALILYLFCLPSLATEVDSFTHRDPLMVDALLAVNSVMRSAIIDAMRESEGNCDGQSLRNALHGRLGGIGWAKLENLIVDSPFFDKRVTPLSDSVYRDFEFTEAWGIHLAKLGVIVRIGDVYVGSDKFGHFLEEGFHYYKRRVLKNMRVEDTIQYGEDLEEGFYGLSTTRIYSYGDLTANYEGMRFWSLLVGDNDAVAGEPLLMCENGEWNFIREFDFSDHLSPALDEGQNCSRFKTDDLEQRVLARVKELEKLRGIPLTCPISPTACDDMKTRYGDLAPRLVTPKCF